MQRIQYIILRMLAAAAVGLMVCVLTLLSAWQSHGESLVYHRTRLDQFKIGTLGSALAEFRNANSRLPVDLEELMNWQMEQPEYEDDNPDDLVTDQWGNRLFYRNMGREYRIIAYGRDGKPGGVGLDADLSDRVLPPPIQEPPWDQFFHELMPPGMFRSCLAIGLIAGTWSLFLMLGRPFKTWSWRVLLLSIAATSILAFSFGTTIAALHVPSGH